MNDRLCLGCDLVVILVIVGLTSDLNKRFNGLLTGVVKML